MTTITRTETRKRGILGKIFLLIFWLFNGLMLWWMIAGFGITGEAVTSATTEATRSGAAVGCALATGMILIIWAAGALILGLLVLLTPGKTIITEKTKD